MTRSAQEDSSPSDGQAGEVGSTRSEAAAAGEGRCGDGEEGLGGGLGGGEAGGRDVDAATVTDTDSGLGGGEAGGGDGGEGLGGGEAVGAARAQGLRGASGRDGDGEERWGGPTYVFCGPFVSGKVVVEVGGTGPEGHAMLRQAGATDVLAVERSALPWSLAAASVDMVICGLSEVEIGDPDRRSPLLAEIKRVLRSDGIAAVRASAGALARSAAAISAGTQLASLVLEHFATVDIVEETPSRVVCYSVSGCEDLAVSEAMAKISGRASHLIALCTSAEDKPWCLSESLLVPIESGEGLDRGLSGSPDAEVDRFEAQLASVGRDRDELREREMVAEDRAARLGRVVATLRKDVERLLMQISDHSAAYELMSLERDRMQRRIAEMQGGMVIAGRDSESLRQSVQALSKEVARLRAALGAKDASR